MTTVFECREKYLKQVPVKPTKPRGPVAAGLVIPGPNEYPVPPLFGGQGYSQIKRAPAYTFGLLTPPDLSKPAAKPNAPLFNIRGFIRKGKERIPAGVLTPTISHPSKAEKVPGPNAYAPRKNIVIKRPPAYSIRPPAHFNYEPPDMWTPPPNMYNPYIPFKNAPAYSLRNVTRDLKPHGIPGPGQYNPNFDYVLRNKPAFNLKGQTRRPKLFRTPPPDNYCNKKFMYPLRTIPAISFGIRHTPYLGKADVYLKSSKLDLLASD